MHCAIYKSTLISLVTPTHEAESTVRTMTWVWFQYVRKDGKVDNNLALVVAIVESQSGQSHIILSWGEALAPICEGGPQRVICSDEFWVVEKESIASAVVEEEVMGYVETENSRGEKFSLDRHHILFRASKQQVVRGIPARSSSVSANLC